MTTQKIIVRDYAPGDYEALGNLYYNTIHQVNIQDYTEEQVESWAPKAGFRWKERFEDKKPLVAMIGDVIVGFAEFEQDGHIDCFYTHHQYIGCGVGSTLMAAIFEIAAQKEIKRIFAEVSITARPFFEKQGFKVTEEQTVDLRGVKLINYKMEKHL